MPGRTNMDKSSPTTLFDKIWNHHTILKRPDGATLLHIGRHLVHDGSRPAFQVLRDRELLVHRPDRTFATPDHYIPTKGRPSALAGPPERLAMVRALSENARASGVTIFDAHDQRQGIIHVVAPEQGITQPGLLMVCGDSHTATHGALGALAFGIGASEVAHVLATQSIWQMKPKSMRVTVEGRIQAGVSAKDLVLFIIARIGVGGGIGHVIEYAGSAIRSATIESRMTICNMSIEAGARAGMIAPDNMTFEYLSKRPYSPVGEDWEKAIRLWRGYVSEPAAKFDREVSFDASQVEPMVTWGTDPGTGIPITGRIPDPAAEKNSAERDSHRRALDYMGLSPGVRIDEVAIDSVFIGSCTNSRIEDLRSAARVAMGRKAVVPAMVVPGSGLVKAQAEAEGLDRIFMEAGFEWRQPGCSMCVGTNGDIGAPGERCASTSNRNFVGRQGKGVRTHLLSPAMAAAAAVTGKFTDVRKL